MNNEFNRLKGDKVEFIPIALEDVEAIHSFASDDEVSKYIGWPLMKNIDETREYIKLIMKRETENTHLYASIAISQTGEVIGTIILFNFDHRARHAEIGYVLHKSHWGKGYITEAVGLVNMYAFNSLRLHRIHARVANTNLGSGKVLIKNGYLEEGRLKDHFFIDGDYYDELIYGIVGDN